MNRTVATTARDGIERCGALATVLAPATLVLAGG